MLRVVLLLSALVLAPAVGRAQPAVPNLRVAGVLAVGEAVAGGSLSVQATFSSEPGAAPAPFSWGVYLAPGGILEGARLIERFGPVRLDAGARTTLSVQASLPLGVTGVYQLAVVADDEGAIVERNEYDNAAFAAAPLSIRAQAGALAVLAVNASASSAREGSLVPVRVAVENSGELSVSTEVRVVLSRDSLISPADVEVAEVAVDLEPGARSQLDLEALIPSGLEAGQYRLGALIDPQGGITELDEGDNARAASTRLDVIRDTLTLASDRLPAATLALPYHVRLKASGGDGRHVFRVASGALPEGLALRGDTLSGVPSRTGRFTFELSVSSHGLTHVRAFAIEVASTGQALRIVTREGQRAALGLAFEQQLAAQGGEPPYAWTLTPDEGVLPEGLDLTTAGVLTGRPRQLGRFSFSITVTDRLGATDAVPLWLEVAPANDVLIALKNYPPLALGEPVELSLEATGGVPPYAWSARSTPPPGLTITEDGRIVGTPTEIGRWELRVRAKDARRRAGTDEALILLSVADAGEFEISTRTLPEAPVRSRYEAVLEARGGTPPLTWRLVPGSFLPDGFYLVPGDGTVAPIGTARLYGLGYRAQQHAFSVRVEDAAGRRRELPLVLEVVRPELAEAASGCRCFEPSSANTSLFGLLAPVLLTLVRRRRVNRR